MQVYFCGLLFIFQKQTIFITSVYLHIGRINDFLHFSHSPHRFLKCCKSSLIKSNTIKKSPSLEWGSFINQTSHIAVQFVNRMFPTSPPAGGYEGQANVRYSQIISLSHPLSLPLSAPSAQRSPSHLKTPQNFSHKFKAIKNPHH
jgi:hypothetical protein